MADKWLKAKNVQSFWFLVGQTLEIRLYLMISRICESNTFFKGNQRLKCVGGATRVTIEHKATTVQTQVEKDFL